ncbi:GGDEF domain-containing protein [Pseudorhodoplanes sp.]|uniref:GGDEF domain-containing protein n=1 Tax=Pseudorhodoplanes sp. TaxID=1934341 RepID=UPI002C089ABD|nr:GGDEF domain-containing protein [Pseudorhodoplanes sp.]HWV52589.1 GGDEF domain-containing protein [Pseudorhodoplanes sp.]
MATSGDEHERTMAFAEIAIGQIKALRQPATPRNFEVWYAYATGYHPSLNESINEILSRRGRLTEAEVEHICNSFLSPTRLSERIDVVGSRVVDEIDQVMAMVDVAIGSTNTCSESLAGVSNELTQADREGLRAIVESLVHTAKEMESVNHTLEERLTASKLEINQLQRHLEVVRNESLTDPLTSLSNRKFFDEAITKAVQEATAENEVLSLLMTDIDHFKTFNDTYGHLTGDQVLRLVAQSVKANVKGQDIAARYGGEEFAIILPNTVLRSAVTVAEHIRRAVMSKELMKRSTGEHLGRITISIGVAMLRPGDTAQSLIGRADACLYTAKHAGRNRVICETDPEFASPSMPATAVA